MSAREARPAVNISWLLTQLDQPRETRDGWMACCPAHDDLDPSLSMRMTDDGVILLHCHAGCEFEEIVEALGIEARDLFPGRDPLPEPRGPELHVPTTNGTGPAVEELLVDMTEALKL